MAEKTGIAWTDHTFNPWIGCAKVSDGCKHCYAETQNKRYSWVDNWGPGAPRKRTSAANWKQPIQWAKQAKAEGIKRLVFCASLADVFDDEVDYHWRNDLWELIAEASDGLEWLILTKRPENILDMFPARWQDAKPDFVRLGVTCENQAMADKRLPILLNSYQGNTFISYEPALGPLRLKGWDGTYQRNYLPLTTWVICGGESGAGCRPMDIEWARDVRDQCRQAGVPFFMKQLGGFPDKRHIVENWPLDLQIQQFPAKSMYVNITPKLLGWG